MGRCYFHSIEAVWKMIARKEWLGCRHDASPMFDIPGSTPMWEQYNIFWFFLISKLICIIFLKIYMLYKRTLVVSDLVLTRQKSENAFDCPWVLNVKLKPQIVLWCFYIKVTIFTLWRLIGFMWCLIIAPRHLDYMSFMFN